MIKLVNIFVLTILVNNFLFSQNSNDIIGIWLNEEKNAKIEIYKSENLFFGKMIWLKEPKDINGEFKTDKNNPNKNLRNKKLLGLKILSNLMWNDKEKEWINGSIYNARDGKTYKLFANLSEQKLKLRGYIGFSLFGKTTIWTKSNSIN
ncbi:MAG: DUF2147 domain-containing protein [Flavobacteriales bacterium TMED288]|nr:SIGNAL peptide protein [Flavobacteriales bacterium]RPG53686.1 MAG: DUF2147 domain-containing protein [Flavobacteriales bacterium TMED288]|tara:strand:+ start:38 stop:484 length:447 start_codon:yes stop_codon:yes gene_type:complete